MYNKATASCESGAKRSSLRVLVLGVDGFIGSRIYRALGAEQRVKVVGLRRRPSNLEPQRNMHTVVGDITNKRSLMEAAAGADVVVNAVSYVGSNEELADQVNRIGSLNLVQVCRQLQIPRLIQMGTTAVYGSGPHRGDSVDELKYRPESAASRSRVHADQTVLGAGGTVIRTNLVYGRGDRWFIPTVVRAIRALGGTVDGCTTRLSVIGVENLGQLVAGMAASSRTHPGVFHAAESNPTSVLELLNLINTHICHLPLASSMGLKEAEKMLAVTGLSRHQFNLLTEDHWYEAGDLWDLAQVAQRGLQLTENETVCWYQSLFGTAQ